MSQSRTVPSEVPVATDVPSGLKVISPTAAGGASVSQVVARLQIPDVGGPLDGWKVAIRVPVGSKTTPSAKASMVRTTSPRSQSQIVTLASVGSSRSTHDRRRQQSAVGTEAHR